MYEIEIKKTPLLRFRAYMEAWRQYKLGEVADIVSGGTPNTNDDRYWNGDIDWYSPIEIGEQIYVQESRKKITELGIQKSSAKILPVGTILFTSRAGIGNTAILAKEGATNQGFQSIIPRRRYLNSYFIFSMTHKLKNYGEVNGAGSTFIEISGKQMSKMPIYLPTLDEQNKIGNFFEKVDRLIILYQRELELLQSEKKTLISKMFTKEGNPIPKFRFKGFSDDWEQRKAADIADFSKGNGYSKSDLLDVGIPIILYGRLYTNYRFWIDDVDMFAKIKNGAVISKGNEVIVPASGETAEDIARASAIIKPGILIGGDLNILHPNNYINPMFLALVISYGNPQKELAKKAQGKSVVHIHNSDIQETYIQYPTKREQDQIVNMFIALDHLIILHQHKIKLIKTMKKTLQNFMFV